LFSVFEIYFYIASLTQQ